MTRRIKSKEELREMYRRKREALTDAEQAEGNRIICEQFFARIDMRRVSVLHTFLPIASKNEPSTKLIIQRVRKDFPYIRLSVPKIRSQEGEMESVYYDNQLLRENRYGVLEPDKGTVTHVSDIDAVIIPLLVFDATGYRVGYGKGYYDRFLAMCRFDCVRIGLSFFQPVEEIPSEKWDIPLHWCVTPDRVYRFLSI